MANYQRWLDRLQVMERKFRPSSWYLFLLMLVAFLLGALSYHLTLSMEQPVLNLGGGRAKQLAEELKTQNQLLASRNLELAVEKEANVQMQTMFTEQAAKQRELERELAFYRAVMAPNENAEGVTIHGMELTASPVEGQQRLKVVLTQLQKRRQNIKGSLDLTLVGLVDNKLTSLQLQDVGAKLDNFDFRYFQVLETPVTFPAEFQLTTIKAKIRVSKGRYNQAALAEQEFSLPMLTGETKEPGIILEQNSQVTDNSGQQSEVRGSND
ncbi:MULTISPECIES: DUF6776 family protein [Shewanella]|uniref:DUF6776 family protein n=1 Tax=Shewanella TaxID=22 RepID=UPI001C6564B0|nr:MULTISPECIES: DUF6776 family protein [Shewanella]QYJ76206.1 hypothetical protein K0H79_04265 [Shewanella sp. FJAT-52076]QYK06124.1 hypothetical protein K0H63_04610 [Shewanella zhangzhouensis]